MDDWYFTVLNLPGLNIEIMVGEADTVLPTLENETLEGLLDAAIDMAAYEGNFAGLVLLRECLLKWADESQSALMQIARDGPYRDWAARRCEV